MRQDKKETTATYIPTPSIRRVCLTNIDDKEVCYISEVMNNFGKVVLKTDEKRRSGTAAEVKNQRSISFHEVEHSVLLSICGN